MTNTAAYTVTFKPTVAGILAALPALRAAYAIALADTKSGAAAPANEAVTELMLALDEAGERLQDKAAPDAKYGGRIVVEDAPLWAIGTGLSTAAFRIRKAREARRVELASDCNACPRCKGEGYLKGYEFNEDGICFKCLGTGTKAGLP